MNYNLSFIGSISYRTFFYLVALKNNNISLENVFIYNYKELDISILKDKEIKYKDFNLNIDISMKELLNYHHASILENKTINELENVIRDIKSEIIIFSGKGGEIVKKNILKYNNFLHIHPGKLPEYRGSTTIYYSILKEKLCHATAFFLDDKIDTGNIIKIMEFEIIDIDFDYIYDPLIRTYLLIDILKSTPIESRQQYNHNTTEYYIIHPVLKKLASEQKKRINEKNI